MRSAAQRRRLQALGIELWRPRDSVAPELTAEALNPEPPLPLSEQPAIVQQPLQSPAAADLENLGWEELQAALRMMRRSGAAEPVFGTGARDAGLMVIGNAPGEQDDCAHEPFVGPAGGLLDAMLLAIGRSRRKNVYIANICKFRPPDDRDPLASEVATDLPFLRRQIELVDPRLILAVGRAAAHNLLGLDLPLKSMRGQVYEFAGRPVLVTCHPDYLLRKPREKAKSWEDLKAVRTFLAAE